MMHPRRMNVWDTCSLASTMLKIILIACGGAIGSVLRYGLAGLTHRLLNNSDKAAGAAIFPWGTLAVNLLGCFAIGALWELCEEFNVAPHLRAFIFVGVLGGFTTFSTFGFESRNLLRDGEFWLTAGNVLLSVGIGIVMVYLGAASSKGIMGMVRQ